MSWFEGARARLHLIFARHASESRFDEEVSFHIDMEAARLARDEGLSTDEARRRAHVVFGGVTQHTETLREGRGLAWLGGLSLDTKLAIRMLLKHPALTLVSVVGMSVAVAIGAVSFSALYTMLDANLPVSEGERIVGIRNLDTRRSFDARATHLHDLSTWRDGLHTVRELGAFRIVERNLITPDSRSESVRIAEMTASGFRIVRVPPLMGRYFHDDDERSGSAPVVVIGNDVWQTRFSARPDIIGQFIQLGDTRHEVIGVMPAGFAFPVNNRVWTPLRLNPSDYEPGHAPSVDVFGRLADGAAIANARREAEAIGQRLATAFPKTHANVRPRVVGYTRTFIDNPEAPWLFHLGQLLVTMLLVVIGTNVAILVYARTASRMGEIAIRTALGASRSRVVAQLFAEALVLSTIAAGVGLLVAHFALEAIDAAIARARGDRIPYWLRFHITPGVVLYCAGLALLAAVIVGVVPALKATGRGVRASLQQLSAGASGMRLGKTWTFLIIAQVTLAVAVLPVAIAGISSWRRIESAQTVLATRQVLTATLSLDRADNTGRNAENDFASRYQGLRTQLVNRLEAEASVASVVFSSNAPGDESTTRVEPENSDAAATSGSNGAVVGATRVGLDYFRTLEIPILAGRGFESGDLLATTSAVVINRSLAKKVFGANNPLGHRLRAAQLHGDGIGDAALVRPWEVVVGVVPDFPVDSSASTPKVYRPLLPSDTEPVTMAIRVKGTTSVSFATRLREITVATSPMLRVEHIKSLDQALYDDSADQRLMILALELVTMSTVLLSAAGIYALMAFTVTRRRREIGIRSALGAGHRRVLMSVLSRVFVQISVGIAVGVGAAGVIDKLLQGGWTGRQAALVLPGVAALMAAVGLLAAIGPANRALRIQPTDALKAE